jgi:hypothetical protein
MFRPLLASVLMTVAVLSGCDAGTSGESAQAQEDVQQQLAGAWLRDYSEQGIHARRLLLLDADGSFRETVRVVDAAGAATEHAHEGTWLYDGTNLKRKYTLMDGKPPSRLNLPFATFAVKFETRNEFVGIDHVHNNVVRYRRVSAETTL